MEDPMDAAQSRRFESDRARSIKIYNDMCFATGQSHDWRHATNAPGWMIGDECVRCQECQLKAIAPYKPTLGNESAKLEGGE
jgi:hypothetical protein